ncbi:hypothetical protein JI749_10260 [Devosia oryziradicis]|uniref:DUF599 family protein n=1 Tax=Devosia oryziradicis TaxID=2801335 RepID=A0ABX7BUN6_9HYPH|nr:hypothetical protein [Devosia oryziradicis]QQR34769.1 hypothetical protein JI749_10260 [Devosia oryziradicis]
MTANTDIIQGVALLVAVVWAAQSANIAAWKYINDLRDNAMMGKIGGVEITAAHARFIIKSDWSSVFTGALITMFSFAVLLLGGGLVAIWPSISQGQIWNPSSLHVAGLGCFALGAIYLIRFLATVRFLFTEPKNIEAAIATWEKSRPRTSPGL